MGFNIPFYIIFGTNLLIEGPVQIVVLFALFFVHRFLVKSIFLLAIMSDFGMAETD